MENINFDVRGMCFLENSVLKKYRWDHRDFEKWFKIYSEYQEYDRRVVKVLDINIAERYYEMELIPGYSLEGGLFNLNFEAKKHMLTEAMHIYQNFFRFKSQYLTETEIFAHLDYRSENMLLTNDLQVKLVDPDEFSIVDIGRLSNSLKFGKYYDTLHDFQEKLSYAELGPRYNKHLNTRMGYKNEDELPY